MIFKYSLFMIVTIASLLNLTDPVSGRLETILGLEPDNNLNLNITATASTPVYSQRLEQLTFTGSQLFNVAWLANLFLFGTAVFIANYVVQLTPSFQDWSASTFSNILGGQETDTTEEVMDPMIENIIGKLVPSRLKENPFGLSTELPFGVRNESKQQVSRKKIPTIRSAAKLRTQKPKLLRLRYPEDDLPSFGNFETFEFPENNYYFETQGNRKRRRG